MNLEKFTDRARGFLQSALGEFIDVVPKSTSGKILRKDLRAREAAPAVQPANAQQRRA